MIGTNITGASSINIGGQVIRLPAYVTLGIGSSIEWPEPEERIKQDLIPARATPEVIKYYKEKNIKALPQFIPPLDTIVSSDTKWFSNSEGTRHNGSAWISQAPEVYYMLPIFESLVNAPATEYDPFIILAEDPPITYNCLNPYTLLGPWPNTVVRIDNYKVPAYMPGLNFTSTGVLVNMDYNVDIMQLVINSYLSAMYANLEIIFDLVDFTTKKPLSETAIATFYDWYAATYLADAANFFATPSVQLDSVVNNGNSITVRKSLRPTVIDDLTEWLEGTMVRLTTELGGIGPGRYMWSNGRLRFSGSQMRAMASWYELERDSEEIAMYDFKSRNYEGKDYFVLNSRRNMFNNVAHMKFLNMQDWPGQMRILSCNLTDYLIEPD